MNDRFKKIMIVFMIGFATTAMYSLPYMKSVFYDPMREALSLNHKQLGNLLSIYGIVATVSYFPGGWLADKYSAKKLVSFSLISTGILGMWMAMAPSYPILCMIFFLFGITTILTYFAAIIKVIRMLGDSSEQGRLFGLYEGFGGVAGTVLSFGGLYFFSKFENIVEGFKAATIMYSVCSMICGVILFIAIKEREVEKKEQVKFTSLIKAVRMPKAWLISAIIFSAYMVFSSLTYLNPYMTEVFKMSMALVSFVAIGRTYVIKFIASPLAGVIADKIGSSTKCLFGGFILVTITQAVFLITPGNPSLVYVALVNMLVLTILMFAFRGIYFATVDESNIPLNVTGIVVGFVSVIGFLPDAFYYTLVGSWLDKYGNTAYKYVFSLSLACSILGIIASYALLRIVSREKKEEIVNQ
ncbi:MULTISPECIES: MFS transporter [Fusobacterium]|jgi:MFS family permease|uniref:Inner membrane protein yihN n=2 Tax=Fusobacterium ulcerans TaxID=861 RepID=A0AAX1TQ34_9FUSO|nr:MULTISPECIES: MFS transporter [Fusobacterium]AVQ27286.1 MFS transporter [Fusobacterium ulcerans]EFS24585.1 hypothetical protein FUAG_00100 [Fusobacterium ulcerans ATCC 49185]EHO82216.1 hypothetical protein HMPREF0402_01149 [Fusobacterium ulcerans 12-1B]MCB8565016.1 MFS transporter [Fusobacterium ulcerans]MCB8648929.1 MFS transporter [Fusobacterium ulcerans]